MLGSLFLVTQILISLKSLLVRIFTNRLKGVIKTNILKATDSDDSPASVHPLNISAKGSTSVVPNSGKLLPNETQDQPFAGNKHSKDASTRD